MPEVAGKTDVVSPLSGDHQRAGSAGDTVTYADGSNATVAAAAARLADVAVVFAGAEDSEGVDRSTMSLASGNCDLGGCAAQPDRPGSADPQVAAANPHTIVVLNTGGPITMPWLDQVQGLFEAWYPGQQDGNAIAALLFGDTDPSGQSAGDLPALARRHAAQSPQQ